jgi:hypothetical protein
VEVVVVLMVINLGEAVDPVVVTLSMEEQEVLERLVKVTTVAPETLRVAAEPEQLVQEPVVVLEFNHPYQVLLYTMQVAAVAGVVVE